MCGHDRGNGAPVPEGAIGASMHPLGVHKYAGGVQSCANRLLLKSVRAPAWAPFGFSLCSKVPSESFAFFGTSACGPDRDRAWQFRHALSASTPLVARLRSSPSGSRARHRLIAAHYCVAARSAPLHAPSPCSACASPRRTRTAIRLIAALPPQGYAALIAHAAPRQNFALSSPARIPASRHLVQPFSVAALTLCGGDTPLVK